MAIKSISLTLIHSLLLTSLNLLAHPGGTDHNGGHFNKTTGAYHCHKKSCVEQREDVNDAIQEAINEERQFSYLYNRSDWKHWSDFDGDCMNTRHEQLQAKSTVKVTLSPDGCYVSKGQWTDPFSGKTFNKASDLDIDHIIPLKWAHGHGGDKWSLDKKEIRKRSK